MSDPASKFTALLSELKRRRVFRVAVVYAGVAFIIFQIIDATFEPLHLPDWAGTLVVVLLALGFPIAVALAWAFDITEKGVVRTAAEGPVEAKAPRRLVISNRVLAIIAVVAVIAAAWSWLREPSPSSATISSIAVLPLTNLMGDPAQDYFVDGMHEALITALSKISALRVISRTSVIQYRENPKPLAIIAKELDVDALVEGSVLKAENQVRITAQLLGTRPERHLWAESYDRELRDILRLHSDVARAIAGEIEVTLTPEEEARLEKKPTENLSAYEDYLNGRYYWAKRTREDTWKAVEFYEAAIAKDSTYALAYSGIAECYIVGTGSLLGVSRDEAESKARRYAQKALELDRTLVEPRTVLAQLQWLPGWDLKGADAAFLQALELDPNKLTTLRRYAYALAAMGRFEDAVARIDQAYRLDPLSLVTNLDMCHIFVQARQYDRAIEQCRKTLTMDPDSRGTRRNLADAYRAKGMTAEAVAEYERLGATWWVHVLKGELDEARRILEESIRQEVPREGLAYIGWRYAALGDMDKAFEWFDKAYAARAPGLIYLKVFPVLDPLHADPRYIALVKKLGLE